MRAEMAALLKVETAARERWIVWTRRTYEALGEAFAELDALRKAAQVSSDPTKEKT